MVLKLAARAIGWRAPLLKRSNSGVLSVTCRRGAGGRGRSATLLPESQSA